VLSEHASIPHLTSVHLYCVVAIALQGVKKIVQYMEEIRLQQSVQGGEEISATDNLERMFIGAPCYFAIPFSPLFCPPSTHSSYPFFVSTPPLTFAEWDNDGSGELDEKEFRTGLNDLCANSGHKKLSSYEVRNIVKVFDSNQGDDVILIVPLQYHRPQKQPHRAFNISLPFAHHFPSTPLVSHQNRRSDRHERFSWHRGGHGGV
jgi:hypothetical protein